MIIVETCPKCGHDLIDTSICTLPPIQRKECPNCGWSWESEQEKILRIPFNPDTTLTMESIFVRRASACDSCPSNPKNGGNGVCFCTLGSIPITS